MVSKTFLSAAALFTLAFAQNNKGGNNGGNQNAGNQGNGGNNNAADSTTLSQNAIQSGSFSDGSQGLGAEDGQAASLTSQNNFINECAGKTLTNGLQITDGSCNGIPMGNIPAKNQMISSIITFPQNGDSVPAQQDFTISVQTQNLEAGSFTNADATYYAAPQTLNGQGQVIGHTHVTVQDLGNSLNPSQPPDPTQFAFFKGINDAGNGKGLLSADVAGGLPAGNYRLCTMTSASNHQPVLMPVAQRGSQDDCTKFTVTNGGGNNNAGNNANANAGQNANANAGQNAQKGQQGQQAQQGQGQQKQNGQRTRRLATDKRSRLARIATRDFVA
ncbi:hypothetical protein N8I77_003798 [Diaporthe amygdali]|uniref:Ribosomal protein s17 n=1 Tax=Phomopsis amygdali TaxID=1214568 RepID=A0AAD9SKL3_PHOAM|nr:hypothetical protein N8I77_003798 [Diaporthe amygdali]